MKTHFIHLRYYLDSRNCTPHNKGGATIGYRVVNGEVHYAIAHCNLKDNFNRKIGRTIVQNRLDCDDFYRLPFDTKETIPIEEMVHKAKKNAVIVTNDAVEVAQLC